MPDEAPPELHLYVKSRKAVTAFYRPQPQQVQATGQDTIGVSSSLEGRTGRDSQEAQVDYMLSDDQARAVAIVEEVAARRGYSVKLIDVGRANPLTQFVEEHLRSVEKYPVLLIPGQPHRLESPEAFTPEALCQIMPAEPQYTRAFSYLKVKTAELDRVKKALLAFNEVKETHMVTGEWDLLVLLEFPPKEKMSKRHVLDFIIDRVAKINGVEDTSTLVPEYSITKFPI